MEQKITDERLIVRYLLGDLTEEENMRLEDRAFAEQGYLDQVLAAENDVIDDYVSGRLSAREQEKFERLFLSSAERREKLDFARALREVVSVDSPSARAVVDTESGGLTAWFSSLIASQRGPRMALAFSLVAAVLIGLVAFWLASENSRLSRQLAAEREEAQKRQTTGSPLMTEQQQVADLQRREEELKRQVAEQTARNQELIARLERERTQVPNLPSKPSSERSFVSLLLLPGALRGSDEVRRLTIPPDANTARLRLGLESTDVYQSFRAEVRDAQDRVIWSRDGLKAQPTRGTRTITLNVPASLLSTGKYVIALRGFTLSGELEDVNFYPLTVLK